MRHLRIISTLSHTTPIQIEQTLSTLWGRPERFQIEDTDKRELQSISHQLKLWKDAYADELDDESDEMDVDGDAA